MSSTVATLFAELGFKIDNQGIDTFRTTLKEIQKELGETMKTSANTNKSLSAVLKKLNNVNSSFNPTKMQEWRKQLNTGVKSYIDMIGANEKALNGLSTKAVDSSRRMKLLTGRVEQGSTALSTYLTRLEAVIAALARLRAAGVNLPRVGGGLQGGGNGSRGGGTGGGHPPTGSGGSGLGTLLAGAGLGTFLKPMLPMGMGVGGVLGAGYTVKEVILAGREMMAMELKMKSVSGESADFARNMEYVRELSGYLGLSLIDAGNAFANIVVTAKDKMNPKEMQRMFLGFNKYYAAVHMTSADQKLANLAIQQMFGKDKIQAQEARLQMGQRVTPFIKLLTEAAKEHFGDKFTSLDDIMRKGLLDPTTLLPIVADKLAAIAENGGALAEALVNSQAEQERFNNRLKEFSYALMKGGLDAFLAGMFRLGADIIPALTVAFKWLFKAIKSVFSILKALGEWVIDHPFLATMAASSLLLMGGLTGLIPVFTAILVNLYAMVTGVAALSAALYRLMYFGGIVLLISLLADLQNYFVMGNKDGILGSWEDFFTEWLSIADKNIALFMLKWEIMKQKMLPNGVDLSFMQGQQGTEFRQGGVVRDSAKLEVYKDILNFFSSVGNPFESPVQKQTKPVSQSIQDMGGDGVRKIDMTFNFNDLPQDVKNSATNGDWTNFGVGFAKTLNVGGLGQNNH